MVIDEFNVLPGYSGVAIHDGWTPYRNYENLSHGLCNAYRLRELRAAAEDGQYWADELATLLVATNDRVKTARENGAPALSARTLTVLTRHYDQLITAGYAANAPPQRTGLAGRPKRTKSANLLRRLDCCRDDVLRFATDFSVLFSNNQAQRDLRMVKLQQKISGCYRTEAGATNYLTVRSYVSTMRKQGHPVARAAPTLRRGTGDAHGNSPESLGMSGEFP